MRALAFSMLALLGGPFSAACAQDEAAPDDLRRRGVYVAPMFSYLQPADDRDASGGGPILGVGFIGYDGVIAFELAGGSYKLSGENVDVFTGSAMYFPASTSKTFLRNLYAIVGMGLGKRPDPPDSDTKTTLTDFGTGYLFPFKIFDRDVAIKGEARYRFNQARTTAQNERGTRKELVFNVGLFVPLSAQPKPLPPPPAPVEVVPPADDDGDGVPNDGDQCPGTTAGPIVDSSGCEQAAVAPVSDASTDDDSSNETVVTPEAGTTGGEPSASDGSSTTSVTPEGSSSRSGGTTGSEEGR